MDLHDVPNMLQTNADDQCNKQQQPFNDQCNKQLLQIMITSQTKLTTLVTINMQWKNFSV